MPTDFEGSLCRHLGLQRIPGLVPAGLWMLETHMKFTLKNRPSKSFTPSPAVQRRAPPRARRTHTHTHVQPSAPEHGRAIHVHGHHWFRPRARAVSVCNVPSGIPAAALAPRRLLLVEPCQQHRMARHRGSAGSLRRVRGGRSGGSRPPVGFRMHEVYQASTCMSCCISRLYRLLVCTEHAGARQPNRTGPSARTTCWP